MPYYKMSSRYILRQEDISALLFDRQSWELHHVNKTGKTILELLSRGSISYSFILDYFTHIFEPLDDIQKSSIEVFFNYLLKANIIEETYQTDRNIDMEYWRSQISQNNLFESHKTPYYLNAPLFVWWDITALCNLRCKQCYSSSGKPLSDELSFSEICAILDQLAQMKIFYVYFLGGEPFLRKDFFTILKYSRSIGLEVMINTNGWFITDHIAQELVKLDIRHVRVSIDGAIQETHDAIRGIKGSFNKAINAIKYLKSAGVTVVGITPTLMHENVNETMMLIDLAYKLHVDEIQLVQVCSVGRGINATPLNNNDIANLRSVIHRKEIELGKRMLITSSEGVWERPFSECVFNDQIFPQIMGCGAGRTCLAISPNGKVRACLLHQSIVGDLRYQDFKQIWEAKDNHNLLQLRQVKEGCGDCPYISICSGPCPMQKIITSEQRKCYVKNHKQ